MITLNAPEMTCEYAQASVKKAVAKVDPGARVSVGIATRRVTVAIAARAAALIEALNSAGFPADLAAD
ncbi:MAG: copper chaperone [Gemmobacter sp.]